MLSKHVNIRAGRYGSTAARTVVEALLILMNRATGTLVAYGQNEHLGEGALRMPGAVFRRRW
ncbi:hypothetical protein C4B68_38670 [Streptomyces dengpaensis]|uniref:Uncharacterized protein n=1 Tax=Streptomyces dengpaensis TaxID=2049881 RepID=A0ABN5ICC5_9ACTN|nr:hypothetical protein C4B68_38670 [Streptomyces dengpaensis]